MLKAGQWYQLEVGKLFSLIRSLVKDVDEKRLAKTVCYFGAEYYYESLIPRYKDGGLVACSPNDPVDTKLGAECYDGSLAMRLRVKHRVTAPYYVYDINTGLPYKC